MILIWVLSLSIWIPITMVSGILDYTISINYNPLFLNNIFNFILWFAPLVGILVLSIRIIWILNLRSLRKLGLGSKLIGATKNAVSDITRSTNLTQKSSNNTKKLNVKKKFTLKPTVRFIIIILIYWIQWIIPCIIILVEGLCDCVSNDILTPVYWLTYTVVLTDPLTILILNPNVKCSYRK